VTHFRFRDYRHDFATKLLGDSGNLKLVQKAFNRRPSKQFGGRRWAEADQAQAAPSPSGR
jgi:hypothetical protein